MGTTTNIQCWSTTAADNDDADSALNWAEGQDPGTVNNSARAMMVAIRKYASDVGGGVTVGGTADAITITTGQDISAAHEAAGFSLRFKAGGTNTGAVTVNVDGEGTEAVERMDGTALQAGDIISGGIYDIAYNATNGGYTLLGSGVYQPIDADLTAIGALAKTDGNIIVGNGTTWVAESGATARTSLGLAIGTNVQAWDANLDQIAALAVTDGNIMVGNGSAWVAESGATARTSLGLGTGDSPQFTAVNIGAASDTTLARVSAGVVSIEGDPIGTMARVNTWTATNTFNGAVVMNNDVTVGNQSTDAVIIKGTTVNANISALLDEATVASFADTVLDSLGTEGQGVILYRGASTWNMLAIPGVGINNVAWLRDDVAGSASRYRLTIE